MDFPRSTLLQVRNMGASSFLTPTRLRFIHIVQDPLLLFSELLRSMVCLIHVFDFSAIVVINYLFRRCHILCAVNKNSSLFRRRKAHLFLRFERTALNPFNKLLISCS
jgi:hypothetical protein